jgi:hypothetical protein
MIIETACPFSTLRMNTHVEIMLRAPTSAVEGAAIGRRDAEMSRSQYGRRFRLPILRQKVRQKDMLPPYYAAELVRVAQDEMDRRDAKREREANAGNRLQNQPRLNRFRLLNGMLPGRQHPGIDSRAGQC